MSYKRKKIIQALEARGFTNITLYYWVKDGWYMQCDQANHVCIGQNWRHCIRECKEGITDQYLKPRRSNF